mmetsp:Transcript_74624/g.242426  ORF Transcript_74624/g.242426 Transcript_74624/m.242426 type:complete len:437 (-) Transcript_74624:177-1487(-)
MFATHQSGVDLSVWGLPAGNKVSGHSNGKPAAPNAADMSKLDPWKVVVPGLEDGASPLNPPGLSPKGRAASVPGLEQVAKAVAGQVVDDEDEDDEEEDNCWQNLFTSSTDNPVQYMEQYMASHGHDWWPMTDMWSSAPSWLQPGDTVCFHGLQQTTSLNGVCATIQSWDEASGRWSVRMPNGTEKFAKPENLAIVQAQACAFPGFAGSGEQANWWYSGALAARQRGREKGTKKGVQARTSSFGSDTTTASVSTRDSALSSQLCEDSSNSDKMDTPPGAWTTVMMRNIPNDYSGTMLLDLLNEQGFGGRYNLVYLPMDYHRKAGFGYAFIDFVSTEEAQRFRERFEGFSDWGLVSHKICNVSWSDALQGVQAHVDRYRNSPVMHDAVPDEFKPMLFEKGKRVLFPPPTKSVRAPRLRKKDPRQPMQHMQREPRRVVA